VDRITELSNEMENVKQVYPTERGYRTIVSQRRRGVKNEDIAELKGVIDGLEEVMAQARAFAEATGSDEEEVEDLIESADDLKVHVQRMLRMHNIEYKGQRRDRDT
jgi:ribosomal protein S15P/S13E